MLRVLIVDDEADAAEVLSLRLKRKNFWADHVCCGQEALEYLAATPVDAVLLDIKMPGMDGLTVLEHIKELHPRPGVIIVSGHADVETAEKCLQNGASFYLLKPIDLDSLCHKIEDVHRQAQLAAQNT